MKQWLIGQGLWKRDGGGYWGNEQARVEGKWWQWASEAVMLLVSIDLWQLLAASKLGSEVMRQESSVTGCLCVCVQWNGEIIGQWGCLQWNGEAGGQWGWVLCAVCCAVCGTLKQWDSKAVCSGMARQWSSEARLRCCVTVRQLVSEEGWQWDSEAVGW
jgi:hypothetical protein